MLATHYAALRAMHVGCVVASGTLFALRGAAALAGAGWANHLALRRLSWAIDTLLLSAALLLAAVVHQYPFTDGWLTTKVLLLVLYVFLGGLALRRARTAPGRALAYGAALATFLSIVAVAHWRDPLGPLRALGLAAG